MSWMIPTTLGVATMLAAATDPSTHSNSAASPQLADDVAHRWNLADIYPDSAAWLQAKTRLPEKIEQLATFSGQLGRDAGILAACLENFFDIDRELSRVYVYASTHSDEDTRAAKPLEMKQEAGNLYVLFSQKSSFIEPELLALGGPTIARFTAEEPRLAPFRHFLDDILRRAPHTLDQQGEQIVATSGLMADTAETLYRVFSNAEIPWPKVRLSNGDEVRLDQAAYTRYRSLPNRDDRAKVFHAFWKKWQEYQNTLGVALYAQVKKDLFFAQVRKHPTCLKSALAADNIPESVYQTLIRTANDNLPTLHRYLRLRGRMLGVKDLKYYDIYPPLVTSKQSFQIETGKRIVLEAVAPLGSDYVAQMKTGFANRWMDVFPRPGKKSGAYSNGSVYDVHPYVLMNYNDDFEAVSTLAHEWGHAMHSFLANTSQPYATSDYPIFVAEVASTFNEALLLDHMLAATQDPEQRLFLLGSALEGLRQTFFRQAMFAEFELTIHQRAEAGEALSGEKFSKIYGEILRRYHGHDAGVMEIEPAYFIEWAYIPHFYYNFYVYKYATSLAASSLFARDVLENVPEARDRYLNVLKAGGATYPYELLRDAGVDLAAAAPYEALMARMNAIMDQIETILAEKDKAPPAKERAK